MFGLLVSDYFLNNPRFLINLPINSYILNTLLFLFHLLINGYFSNTPHNGYNLNTPRFLFSLLSNGYFLNIPRFPFILPVIAYYNSYIRLNIKFTLKSLYCKLISLNCLNLYKIFIHAIKIYCLLFRNVLSQTPAIL